MPRPRPLASYSYNHYSKLAEQVVLSRKPILLPGERTASLTIRSDFYAFRRVAYDNQAEARRLGIPLEMLVEVQATVKDEGLLFRHRDDNLAVVAIEGALRPLGVMVERLKPEPLPAVDRFDRAVDAANAEAVPVPILTQPAAPDEIAASVERLLQGLNNG